MIKRGINYVKMNPLKAFFLVFSAYFLTLFSIYIYIYIAEPLIKESIYSTETITIEAHAVPEQGRSYVWLADTGGSNIPSFKSIYESCDKSGKWNYVSSDNGEAAFDLIGCTGEGSLSFSVYAAPDTTLCFLKGKDCGEVEVSTESGSWHLDLYEEANMGNTAELKCFSKNLWALNAIKVLAIAVVFCLWLCVIKRSSDSIVLGRKPAEENSGRLSGLDLVRVYAVLSVISVHGLLFCQYYTIELKGEIAFFTTVLRWALFPCVALFFMLSGFFMIKKELSRKYYAKIIPLFVAYIFITFVWQFTLSIIKGADFSVIVWLKQMSEYEYSSFFSQYVCLFLLIPFLNICWRALDPKGKQILCVICAAITGLAPGFQVFIPRIFLEMYPITYYLIGAYISEFRPTLKKKSYGLALLMFWLVSTAAASISFTNGGAFSWNFLSTPGLGYQMFPNIVISVLIFLLLYDVEIRNGFIRGFLRKVSTLSFEIYLFSLLTDALLWPILQKGRGFYEMIWWYPVMCLSSFALSFFLASVYRLVYSKIASLLIKKQPAAV